MFLINYYTFLQEIKDISLTVQNPVIPSTREHFPYITIHQRKSKIDL
jgi:hypothetical protein